jgi:hypothetical protein
LGALLETVHSQGLQLESAVLPLRRTGFDGTCAARTAGGHDSSPFLSALAIGAKSSFAPSSGVDRAPAALAEMTRAQSPRCRSGLRQVRPVDACVMQVESVDLPPLNDHRALHPTDVNSRSTGARISAGRPPSSTSRLFAAQPWRATAARTRKKRPKNARAVNADHTPSGALPFGHYNLAGCADVLTGLLSVRWWGLSLPSFGNRRLLGRAMFDVCGHMARRPRPGMTTRSACGSAPIGGSWKGSSAAQAWDGGRAVLEFSPIVAQVAIHSRQLRAHELTGFATLVGELLSGLGAGARRSTWAGSRPSPAARVCRR